MSQIQVPIMQLLTQLNENRNRVAQGWNTNNKNEVQNGIEGLALLIGRCLTQISTNDGNQFVAQTLGTILDAQEVIKQTTSPEEMFFVDTTRPSKWLSFDGELKFPLYKAQSKIPHAGNGLFCERAIKRGECIGPTRVKVANTGEYFNDWEKFPISSMVNHHPIPNISIVRGDAPFGLGNRFGETCYFVANRDIPANKELVSDYRDKGWAEWDYYDHIPLPFEQWDANCLNQYGGGQSIPQMVLEQPQNYFKSAGMIGGPALVYASTKSDGLLSSVMALGGLALTGYSTMKDL